MRLINKAVIFLFFFSLVLLCWNCKDSKDIVEKKYLVEKVLLKTFDTTKLRNAIELNESVKINQFSNFKIVYFDKNSLKLFLELDSQKNKFYFTYCVLDSLIQMNLVNDENPDLIYVGKFKFISEIYGDFSFFAINTFDKHTAKYVNIFSDYFILDNNSVLDIVKCDKFIDQDKNALMVSFYEGTGNYLDFRIYGLTNNIFQNLYEPKTPLENGLFAIDSTNIYLLEGINAFRLFFTDGEIKQELLKETPVFNSSKEDKTLAVSFIKNELIIPKLIFLSSQSKLNIVMSNNSGLNERIVKINYDNDFFEQNFNSYIPKKSGLTTLEFINPDNLILGRTKIVIN